VEASQDAAMSERELRPTDAPLGLPSAQSAENLLDWLYALRDRQRASRKKAAWVVKGRDLPWERNRQGIMQWYLHPALEHMAIRTMLFFRQQIPPGGRSGVQRTPGGAVLYVIEGRGYTLLDGERHDWEAEDVIDIPVRPDGVTVEHVNLDGEAPAVFVCADLNLVEFLGVDRGAVLEQLSPAPENGP
jgi:gentisate 1,2-dioxygenase